MNLRNSLIFFVFCFASFISCTTENENDMTQDVLSFRSAQEAIEIAKASFYDVNKNNTRSSAKVEISDVRVINSRKNRSSSTYPLYYIVNFEDSLGYAVISAPENVTPLIGIVDEGNYNDSVVNSNNNVAFLMCSIENYIEQAKNSKELYHCRNFRSSSTFYPDCGPKLPFRWDQNYPFGNYFSNQKAGCANIASAMIMAYYRKPLTMRIDYVNSPFTITFDWPEICRHLNTRSACYELYPNDVHRTLSQFVRQIGKDNESDDTVSGITNTLPGNCLNSLRRNGYACSSFDNFSEIDCVNYLRNDYLIYIYGFDIDGYGHIWVMDGFKYLPQTTSAGMYDCYFHHNWGAGGDANGFFLSNVYETYLGYSYDYGIEHYVHNYCYRIKYSAVKFMGSY